MEVETIQSQGASAPGVADSSDDDSGDDIVGAGATDGLPMDLWRCFQTQSARNALKNSERHADRARKLGLTQDTRATVQCCLDDRTLVNIMRLRSRGVYDDIHGTVSTGKEANVYFASGGPFGQVAVKVFKTSVLTFKDRSKYVEGEFRYRNGYRGTNPRKMVTQWAEKEFRNLRRLFINGCRCPIPITLKTNVLAMGFLGTEDGDAAPLLKDAGLDYGNWRRLYLETIAAMRWMFRECRLVHGDLSEYNMIYHCGHVYIIDVSQSTEHDHPHARDFLRRDCVNVTLFFEKILTQTKAAEDDEVDCRWDRPVPGRLLFRLIVEERISSLDPEILPPNDGAFKSMDEEFFGAQMRALDPMSYPSLAHDQRASRYHALDEAATLDPCGEEPKDLSGQQLKLWRHVECRRRRFAECHDDISRFVEAFWKKLSDGEIGWTAEPLDSNSTADTDALRIAAEEEEKVWRHTWMPASLSQIGNPLELEKMMVVDDKVRNMKYVMLEHLTNMNAKRIEDDETASLETNTGDGLAVEGREPNPETPESSGPDSDEQEIVGEGNPEEKRGPSREKKETMDAAQTLDALESMKRGEDLDGLKATLLQFHLGGKVPKGIEPQEWKRLVKFQRHAQREAKSEAKKKGNRGKSKKRRS